MRTAIIVSAIIVLAAVVILAFSFSNQTQKTGFNGTIYYSNGTLYFRGTTNAEIKGTIYYYNGTHSTEINNEIQYDNFDDTIYIKLCNSESYNSCEMQCKQMPGKICKSQASKLQQSNFEGTCYYYYAQQWEGDPCSTCVIQCGQFTERRTPD